MTVPDLESIKNDRELVKRAARALTPEILGSIIDNTLLNPAATIADIEKLCVESDEIGSYVCVYGSRVPDVCYFINQYNLERIRGIAAVAGFPAGAQSTKAKKEEAYALVLDGADEVDMVLNVGKLLDGDYSYVKNDIKQVAFAVKQAELEVAGAAYLKAIQENCLLSEGQKMSASILIAEAARETGVRIFAKTSTGFGKPKDADTPVGATLEDVWLMRQVNKLFQDNRIFIGIKAAGGIRDLYTAIQMMLAGGCFNDDLSLKENLPDIFRIGTSTGKKLVEDLKKASC